jgi:hypothetical protein
MRQIIVYRYPCCLLLLLLQCSVVGRGHPTDTSVRAYNMAGQDQTVDLGRHVSLAFHLVVGANLVIRKPIHLQNLA